MAESQKKPKQMSGGAKLKAKGLTTVLLGMTPDQIDEIDRAGVACGITHRTQFLIFHGLKAAKDILQNSSK